MGQIFISYNRSDTEYAHQLADVLEKRGFNVWIDARLDYGTQWPQELQKQLDACDALIVIMTPRSFESEWVQSELQRARRKLKPIFPLLLEGDEPWLSVESTQFYDVRGARLPEPRFYAALARAVKLSKPAQTSAANARLTSQRRTGVAVAMIALGAVAFVAFAIFAAGPLLRLWLNPSAPATADSASQEAGIRPTHALEVPLTGPEEEALVVNTYDISRCCGEPGKQRSDALDFTIPIKTNGVLRISFNAASDVLACSDVVLHILWDGVEIYTTDQIGPGTGKHSTGPLDLSSLITRGTHTLTLSPEGVVGGCNSGTLGGWAGKLTVHTGAEP